MSAARRLLRAVGIAPPLVALATFAVLALATFVPFAAGGGADAGAARPVPVRTAVPDAWLDGLAALRAGDAAAALQALRVAESRLGEAPPVLLRARLFAATLAGDGVDAELTAEKLALRTGAEDVRWFVVGLAEAARSERAGLQAQQPGADPAAFDRAIRHAAAAALAFEAASLLHEDRDWPAARRNAERLLARRHELQRRRDQAERDRRREQEPQQPEPQIEPEPVEQEIRRPDDAGLLTAAELQALLRRLAEAEDEKRSVRRAVRDARSAAVEQDW